MCLGVPGKIVSLGEGPTGLPMGKVDFGGVQMDICLMYTPEAQIGDYVLAHVGFALSVLDEAAAQQLFTDLAQIAALQGVGEPQPTAPAEDETR